MNTRGIHSTVHKMAIHDDVVFGFTFALAIAARAHMQSVVPIQAGAPGLIVTCTWPVHRSLGVFTVARAFPPISPSSKSEARMPSTWRNVFAHALHADHKRQS